MVPPEFENEILHYHTDDSALVNIYFGPIPSVLFFGCLVYHIIPGLSSLIRCLCQYQFVIMIEIRSEGDQSEPEDLLSMDDKCVNIKKSIVFEPAQRILSVSGCARFLAASTRRP